MRTTVAIALLQGWVSIALAESPPPLMTIGTLARGGPGGHSAPVRVRGTVTYCDPTRQCLGMQDGQAGMFARIPTDTRQFRPGQRVELTGTVGGNGCLDADDVRFLGDDRAPAPVPALPADLAAGKPSGVRVVTAAVIRSIVTDGDHVIFHARAGRQSLRVFVCDLPPSTLNLDGFVDAEVQITGVSRVAVGNKGEAEEVRLLAQSLRDVNVTLAAPESPFRLPVTPFNKIPEQGNHRVRVSGTAAGPVVDGILKLRTDGRSVTAAVAGNVTARTGEPFEAVGFPSRRDGQVFLEDAIVRGFAPREGGTPDELLPILSAAGEIHRMPVDEVCRGYPVRLRGTLTFHDSSAGEMFVHDGRGGIFVYPPADVPSLTPGSVVLVEGYSDPGGFAPAVRATRVTVLREGRLPDARHYGYDELVGGRQDCQWVEVEAVVRGTGRDDDGKAVLMIRLGPRTAEVRVARTDPDSLRPLFGATVRIRAVCGSRFNPKRQWEGLLFYVPSATTIEVRRSAPPDLSVLAPRTIQSLSQFHPELSPSEPIKLLGRILSRRRDSILVQDATGGIAVDLQPRQAGSPGERAEVEGFLVRRANGWALEDGLTRVVPTPVEAPGPMDLTPDEAAAGDYTATLIRVEALVVEQFSAGESDHVLLLQSAGGAGRPRLLFPAILPRDRATKELLDLRPGTRVRVTGACGPPYDRSMIASFRVLLRDADDVEVIAQPPWWTPRKAQVLALVIAALAAVAGAWVVTLRRRVTRQTEQIRRRLEWEASLEAHYRDLFESASDPVFTLDPSGAVTAINLAGRRLTGLAEGASLLAVVVPESANVARELIGSQAPLTREVTLAGPAGPVVLEVSARPMLHAAGSAGVQAIARDLTQRRRLEADLRQAQKMEAIGRLAGGVAHDFNNLLTVINGNAEVLRTRLSKADAGLVDEIARAGEQAATLTRQLLTFSRKEVVSPRVLCPNTTISSLRKMLGRLIGARIELVADLDESAGSIRIDPGQLEQVLVNLAINARDAMPHGGSLTIRTLSWPGSVRVEVSDTGAGMDADTLAQAFEPFFTTKAAGEGTGLGLATVKSIVEQAGGTIAVRSRPGQGTTFTIDFPRAEEAPASPVPVPSPPPPANREVILLVEDEPAVQLLERRVLEMGRYEVLVASSGEEALGLLDRHHGPIDLLVTDVVMPGMSGRELAQAITRRRPGLPALFLSGYTPDEVLKEGIRAEGAHFLQKPFTPSSLLGKVRDVLSNTNGSSHHHSSGSSKQLAPTR